MRDALGRLVLLAVAVAVAVGLLGLVGAPTPSLFGGLVGAAVVALTLPRPPSLHPLVGRSGQAVIGLVVAVEVDLEALGSLGSSWPAVIAVIGLTLVASIGLGQLLRRDGVSATTATFASVAGGASSMTALAQDAGADQRIVAVVQYVRVLVILLTLPLVVSQVFDTDTGTEPAPALLAMPAWVDVALVLVVCVGGPLLGKLLRIPSPALLGALVVGVGVGATGPLDEAVVPPLVQAAGFVVIGVQAGIGFTRQTLALLRGIVVTVLVSIVLLIVFCAALALPLAEATGVSRLDAYLATSPGGLPVVLATATGTGGDLTFISAVQLLRLLAIILTLPLATAWVRRRRRR
ncbi:AbrB family transcriptional regulator [Aeromicrobium sp. CF4.19]|uniref:AbrB family transcriptional regulator n=1 Tax=Aeromicrobium sp. CF4.19 TaxID=3373082 RepID=UPI003EE71D62